MKTGAPLSFVRRGALELMVNVTVAVGFTSTRTSYVPVVRLLVFMVNVRRPDPSVCTVVNCTLLMKIVAVALAGKPDAWNVKKLFGAPVV